MPQHLNLIRFPGCSVQFWEKRKGEKVIETQKDKEKKGERKRERKIDTGPRQNLIKSARDILKYLMYRN